MDINLLQKNFGRMGARLAVSLVEGRFRRAAGIDIGRDGKGEFFDIRVEPNATTTYDVVDVDARARHLLLLTRDEDNKKNKFLCGHDERHWFVCAVPGGGIARVRDAMEALQPVEVRLAVNSQVKRAKHRLLRRNEAFVRQGEWFFLPSPELVVNPKMVNVNEPISRGNGGKAHWCQFLYRTGGETVMVCNRHPSGVSPGRHSEIIAANPNARMWNWRAMRRNASVFVRGTVRHPDHKTILLDTWHQVLMNTEAQAPGARHVVFLD
ncbi:MAG: hypothetical protein MSG64_20720 [Pyrinomonadaceae bacterium MAG19_C2-C3]|nr:hypothetical protein [Pyrinomonadaceae bacterium MAG19_C2-C3]